MLMNVSFLELETEVTNGDTLPITLKTEEKTLKRTESNEVKAR